MRPCVGGARFVALLILLASPCSTFDGCDQDPTHTPFSVHASVHRAHLPLCKEQEHTQGFWEIPRIHSCGGGLKKDFVCCDARTNAPAIDGLCPAIRGFGALSSFNGTLGLSNPFQEGCQCGGLLDIDPWELYKWYPHDCQLLHFNASSFCEVLGPRTILFVGDSLVSQSMQTLTSLLAVSGGKCVTQMLYAQSVFLSRAVGDDYGSVAKAVRDMRPSILVMNSGAHVASNDQLRDSLQRVHAGLEQLAAEGIAPQVFWMTQVPGHVNCLAHSAPFSSYAHFRHHTLETLSADRYRWSQFAEFDNSSVAFARERGWHVLDVSPLQLRPDGHVGMRHSKALDCLHFCVPGPLNLVAELVHHLLLTGQMGHI